MIMTNVREEHNIKVGICDRNVKGLQFADDIDALIKRETNGWMFELFIDAQP